MRRRFTLETEMYRLPQPPQPAVVPAAFCLLSVPPGLPAPLWMMQQTIYQLAFEQAQAVARPSLPERDLLAVWN
jgi:hypothetical protein